MTYNTTDPISLEPFTDSSRRIVFHYNCGSVHYDFDVFYNNIKHLKVIPHTREPFRKTFKRKFNEICDEFGEEPVFKIARLDNKKSEHTAKPDIPIIVVMTTIIGTLIIVGVHALFQWVVNL